LYLKEKESLSDVPILQLMLGFRPFLILMALLNSKSGTPTTLRMANAMR